MELVMFLR